MQPLRVSQPWVLKLCRRETGVQPHWKCLDLTCPDAMPMTEDKPSLVMSFATLLCARSMRPQSVSCCPRTAFETCNRLATLRLWPTACYEVFPASRRIDKQYLRLKAATFVERG